MITSSLQTTNSTSGFFNQIRQRLTPAIPWERVKEAFSSLSRCFRSRPSPASDKQVRNIIPRKAERRSFLLKCFAVLAAGTFIGAGTYVMRSRWQSSQNVNEPTDSMQNSIYSPRLFGSSPLPSTFPSVLPTIELTEEVPYQSVDWIISDLFGPDKNGATISADFLPNGLEIVNLPMRILSTLPFTNGGTLLKKIDSNIYLSPSGQGYSVVDVTNPLNPFLVYYNNIGFFPAQNNAELLGNYIYGYNIIDISNLYNPRLLNTIFNVDDMVDTIIISNKYAYCIIESGAIEFAIADISNPSNPKDISSVTLPLTTDGSGMAMIDNNHFVFGNQFYIVNVTNTTQPTILSFIPSINSFGDIVISENYGYVDNGALLNVVNFNNLKNPKIEGSLPLFTQAGYALSYIKKAILGNLLYAVDGGIFRVINISNKTNPVSINNVFSGATGAQFCGLIISGDYCYYTDSSGLKIVPRGNTFAFQGTPAGGTQGNYTITLTAKDQNGNMRNGTFNLLINPAIIIQAAIPNQLVVVGTSFNYFINANTFKQVNGDLLKYSASPMPGWLQLNPNSGGFSGIPQSTDAGTLNLKVTASDAAGASSSTSFQIKVVFGPTLNLPISNQIAKVNSPFNFTINANTFIDKDGDPLSYAASSKGSPLPNWLTFNSEQLTLTGTPIGTDAGNALITIVAEAPNGLSAQANFQILIVSSAAPVLLNPIGNQIAEVGQEFKYYVSSNTFEDPYGRPITYSVSLLGGTPLPAWLSFVNRTFSGTPGRGDTDAFSDRVLGISLNAASAGGTNFNTFNINVSGESNAALATAIVSPIISILGAAFAIYKKRAWILNYWNKKKYQKIGEEARVGEFYFRELSVPETDVTLVRALIRGKKLDRDGELPQGFSYNRFTNAVESKKVPKPSHFKTMTIQVIGEADKILEEFVLTISASENTDLKSSSVKKKKKKNASDIELEEVSTVETEEVVQSEAE